jgi:hypothetical protein
MTDLWFEQELENISRRGALLFAVRPGGVWAVLTQELVSADDLALESGELLGLYGAAVHGVGHLLLGAGVALPTELEHWATAPDVPMAALGSWIPRVISIDGSAQLALGRDFDSLRAVATTGAGRHVLCIAPSAQTVVKLVTGDLDAPDWDQQGDR